MPEPNLFKSFRHRIALPLLAVLTCLVCLPSPALPASGPGLILILRDPSSARMAAMAAGARALARERGVSLQVTAVSGAFDGRGQAALVDRAVARGVKAIVINPADPVKVAEAVARAQAAGVKVVVIGPALDAATMARAGLVPPRVAVDRTMAASQIGSLLSQEPGGRGRVMILASDRGPGPDGETLARAVTDYSGLEAAFVIRTANRPEAAFALVSERLIEQRPVEAIVCGDDRLALGALKALENAGLKGRVTVTGFGNSQAVRPLLADGRLAATVDDRPELMGRLGLAEALAALAGEKPGPLTLIQPDLVTARLFGRTLALSLPDRNGPFHGSILRGVEAAAARYGLQTVILQAGGLAGDQNIQLKELARRKPVAVILAPVDPLRVDEGLAALSRAGVPVITLGERVEDPRVICHVGSDDLAGGGLAGEEIARALSGQGRVVELIGRPGSDVTHERGMGFSLALNHHPGVDIVAREVAGFDRTAAARAIRKIIARGDRFDAVFAHNDAMILGALDALSGNGQEADKVLIGYGATAEGRRAVKKGRLTATVALNSLHLGRLAVQRAVEWLRGEDVPIEDLTAPIVVNIDNPDQPPVYVVERPAHRAGNTPVDEYRPPLPPGTALKVVDEGNQI